MQPACLPPRGHVWAPFLLAAPSGSRLPERQQELCLAGRMAATVTSRTSAGDAGQPGYPLPCHYQMSCMTCHFACKVNVKLTMTASKPSSGQLSIPGLQEVLCCVMVVRTVCRTADAAHKAHSCGDTTRLMSRCHRCLLSDRPAQAEHGVPRQHATDVKCGTRLLLLLPSCCCCTTQGLPAGVC
jgi:hypothetical protein